MSGANSTGSARGAGRGLGADRLGRGEVGRRARRVVPVVALHAGVVLGQHRAGQAVARRAARADEAERVAEHAHRRVAVERGALGVVDARIGARRVLATLGERDGLLGLDRPRVPEVERAVERRGVAREQRRVRQARVRVLAGVARDGERGLDGRAQRTRREVGGRGRALALAEVHGHRQAAVALELERLDLAQAHRDVEAGGVAGRGLDCAGAEAAGERDGVADHALEQRRVGVGADGFGHGERILACATL
jgi:hypothetical protein